MFVQTLGYLFTSTAFGIRNAGKCQNKVTSAARLGLLYAAACYRKPPGLCLTFWRRPLNFSPSFLVAFFLSPVLPVLRCTCLQRTEKALKKKSAGEDESSGLVQIFGVQANLKQPSEQAEKSFKTQRDECFLEPTWPTR